MNGYTSLGTNDLHRAADFYDALLVLLDIKRIVEAEDFIVWGKDPEAPMFSIHIPYDGKPATVGNGVMVAFRTASLDQISAVYHKALELGGTDEGAPGKRADGFHAGYFRDLDGNKLNAFFMG